MNWTHYSFSASLFEADFPGIVDVRCIEINGNEFAREYRAVIGRNSLLVRCTLISSGDSEVLDDAALLSLGGWDINEKDVDLQRVTLNGRSVLSLVRRTKQINLHRVFFQVGDYHYRLDFNEREEAAGDIDRFFKSVTVR